MTFCHGTERQGPLTLEGWQGAYSALSNLWLFGSFQRRQSPRLSWSPTGQEECLRSSVRWLVQAPPHWIHAGQVLLVSPHCLHRPSVPLKRGSVSLRTPLLDALLGSQSPEVLSLLNMQIVQHLSWEQVYKHCRQSRLSGSCSPSNHQKSHSDTYDPEDTNSAQSTGRYPESTTLAS